MACLTIYFFIDTAKKLLPAALLANAKMDVVSRKSGHGQKLIRGSVGIIGLFKKQCRIE